MTQEGVEGGQKRYGIFPTMKFQRKSCEEGDFIRDTPFISTVFQLGIARTREVGF
jgi:hypothetical protein